MAYERVGSLVRLLVLSEALRALWLLQVGCEVEQASDMRQMMFLTERELITVIRHLTFSGNSHSFWNGTSHRPVCCYGLYHLRSLGLAAPMHLLYIEAGEDIF